MFRWDWILCVVLCACQAGGASESPVLNGPADVASGSNVLAPAPPKARPTHGRLWVEVRAAVYREQTYAGLWPWKVTIYDAETGELICSHGDLVDREPIPPAYDLPAGRYRVVAEGQAMGNPWMGVLDARVLGRADQVVTVPADGEVHTKVSLSAGGFLAIELSGDAREEDLAAFHRRFEATYIDPNEVLLDSAAVQFHLHSPGFPPEDIVYLADYPGSSHPGPFERNWWVPGPSKRSEMLPVGTHELVGTTWSGREMRRTVVIQRGQTTEVSFNLALE